MRTPTAALLLASSLLGTACIEGYDDGTRKPGQITSETDDSSRDGGDKCDVVTDDEVIIRTEADFDELDAPDGCWDLYGALIIEGAQVSSLARLGGLRSVDHLTIRNTNLTTVDGKRIIESLGKTVITGNKKLLTVDGLRLDRWAGDTQFDLSLQIKDNDVLESIEGFASLAELDGDLEIADNPKLVEASFASLTQAASVEISGNAGLELLELDSLARVGNITLRSNPKLAIVERMDAEEIGRLTVDNNDSLTDLSGFEGVVTIGGTLMLRGNAALSNIDAIFMMQGVLGVTAMDNATLPTCRVAAIRSCVGFVGTVVNERNAGALTDCPGTPSCF